AGVWSKETVIHIFIKPPYWQTWWFIGLVVIAVGSIFFFFIKYIAQRNLRERILRLEKEQAVEKERNRIANDMHDDLGSGLTKIAILSEVAKTQLGKREAVTEQLEKISYSSRELVDSLQDIIWVLNPKNDLLESMAAYIREYALKFFEATDIHLYFDYPEYMPVFKLSEEQRRNTFLVLKETLNNTAKHSHCTEVVIKFHVFENNLQISIQDNGRGFNNKKIRGFANGLANMRSRMKQIGGYYDIDSVINKGTKTTLTIPL
ncbi:MAG: sensor histidine kinase, partial [Flavisolibacter sp.]